MLVFIRFAMLFAIVSSVSSSLALAKKRPPADDVGFADKELRVFGSDHLFMTPSGNIVCFLESGRLYCERLKPEYVTIYIETTGNPTLVTEPHEFSGGHGPAMTDPILPYSMWWSNGSIACLSEEKGLTCKNREGHGFLLSVSKVQTF